MENRRVEFKTVTYGNPNNLTNASQGITFHVDMPIEAGVRAVLNGRSIEWKLRDLLQGARSGKLGEIDSPAWRFHRAPHPDEFVWNLKWKEESDEKAYYYVRVRQVNDQWAWSSPIFVGD